MATLSPTPFATSAFQHGRLPPHGLRQPRSRSNILRPNLRRQSPLSVLGYGHGFSADAPMMHSISIGDSSDEDIPAPMNFSALTKAILEDRPSVKARTPIAERHVEVNNKVEVARTESPWMKPSSATPSRGALRIIRKSPPPTEFLEEGSAPRVVHLGSARRTPGLRKSPSAADGLSSTRTAVNETHDALITPAYPLRTRPTVSRSYSALSNDFPSHRSGASSNAGHSAGDRDVDLGRSGSRHGTSEERGSSSLQDSTSRGHTTSMADNLHGSVLQKRGHINRSVRGAPMRRPFRRRDSDAAEDSPLHEGNSATKRSPTPYTQDSPAPRATGNDAKPMNDQVSVNDFAARHLRAHEAHPAVPSSLENSASLQGSAKVMAAAGSSHAPVAQPLQNFTLQSKSTLRPAQEQPAFKIPALPPPLPSMYDQENEPPPTFKRNKPLGAGVLAPVDKINILSDQKPAKPLITDISRPKSPPRQALLQRNINTPQRVAPPPPKMNVLETATATAGASTVKSKKKRTQISINGKVFTHRGRLGKGGSSDVYRVMAENDKMFALKRVNLADCSEDIVRGYKGEIELLRKLKDVDRVVKLYDWEVNEAKQSLSVLMEIGESDFNSLLNRQLNPSDIAPENVKLDMSFTRYYWREMLCCVAAIHEHDIVHSDLKPSNFLLIQGRLKLIDFGIANAIDVDNTVNVHRETNVGTPNYMSPESLIDTNAEQRGNGTGGGAQNPNAPKLMKLGKPCDVWTLGCILYQMTYGRPPFAHIKNQWHRVMAIINPNHIIEYPDHGIGGVVIPSSLKDCLKSCLTRDASLRPTVAQLLDEKDRFLNPDREVEKWTADGAVPMTEHVLEQILTRIVERCRDPKRGIPTDEEMRVYPRAFLERVKEMHKV